MANILGFLGVELGLNTASFKAGADKATYAAKQFSGQLRQEFSQLGSSFSQLGQQLGASFGPVGGIVNSVMQGIGALGSAIKTTGSNVPVLMQLAGATAGVGAAAVAAVAGYAALAMGGAHAIQELIRMSEKTGVSIRDLQTLKAVGESVDVPLDSMARGFRTFSRALVAGADGSGRASIALHNLGVTAHDPYEALLQVADGISKVKDHSLQSADATALFGSRMGQSLLPILIKGRDGITEYSDVVERFGGVVDKDAVKKTEEWKKSTVELSTAWDGLKIAAVGFLPIIASATDGVAKYVAAWSHLKDEGITNWLKDVGSLLTTGKVSLSVSQETGAQSDAKSKQMAADQAAHDQDQSAANETREKQEKAFNLLKEGGAAGVALKAMELRISQDIANEDFADAAIAQAKLPALKEAAKLESERNAALLSLPKTTEAFVDEQAVTVTKSYGEALKAIGPESAEAARQQAVSAEVEKLANKQRQEGIYGTKQAVEALKEMSTAANDASLANVAFSKSAEASKLLESFSDRMQESTDKMHAAAAATDKIGKAQAELDFGLDKAKKALADQGSAYQELLKSATATDEEKKQAADLLERNTRALLADTDALEKNKEALAEKISAETITKQEQVNAATKDYLDLLSTEPEWEAKADHAARQEATSIGLKGVALKNFLDLKHQEADMQHSEVAPKESAAKALEPGTKSGQNEAAANLAAIREMSAGYLQQGGNVKVLDKALMEADLRVQQLKAANGSMFAGVKAGMLQFAGETKTLGQSIQTNIVKGLNNVNSAFAKSIVEGKNLGKAMKGVAKGIAEDFLQQGLRMVESWIINHISMSAVTKTTAATDAATQIALNKTVGISAAGLAGANAVMSFSAAPWPLDMGAPAFGASMFAEALSFAAFEQGGIVPKTGMAKVHEQEMVLPRPIAEKVTKMADPDAGRMANRKNVTVNMNVSTPNASSFGHSQNQIQTKAHLAATKMAKRNG